MSKSVDQEYDRQTFEVMQKVIRSDWCCVDIGAHAGKILSKIIQLAPGGKHYAFEPQPYYANHLKGLYKNVVVYQVALSNETGTTQFHKIVNADGYSGIKLRDTPFEPEVELITVPMNSLDTLIPESHQISFMKIDVEGAEYNVISGGLQTIERCKPFIIFECSRRTMSVYGFTLKDIYSILVDRCQYNLSTMRRWLNNESPYSLEEFQENKNYNYMWLAYGSTLIYQRQY